MAHSQASLATVSRVNMLTQQLLTNHVTDPRVLHVFEQTPREMFLPKSLVPLAYGDRDVPLGQNGRVLVEPMTLARLIQLADIAPSDVVLDVGCGTGYSTALLAQLAHRVTAIENEDILASTASHNLQKLQLSNVKVTISPLAEGDEKSAPFDVICIAGGAETIPSALGAQLREGGRMVWVKVNPDSRAMGWVCVGVKKGGVISHREIFDTQWRCLPALTQPKNFTF